MVSVSVVVLFEAPSSISRGRFTWLIEGVVIMIVGTLTVELFIGEAQTLKDKRRELRSIIERVKSRYNVSIAEVDRQDSYQRATLGVACVSNETAHVQSILSNVEKYLELQGNTHVVSIKTEIL